MSTILNLMMMMMIGKFFTLAHRIVALFLVPVIHAAQKRDNVLLTILNILTHSMRRMMLFPSEVVIISAMIKHSS